MQQHPYPPPRARIPIGLILSVALVAMLIAAGVIAIFWREWLAFAEAYPNVADLLRFVAFAAPVSIAVGYAYAGLAIVWRRWGTHEYIKAYHITQLANAQRQLPRGVQSVSWHDSHKELPALPPPEPVSGPAMAVPTFATMVDQGLVGPGRKLTLGYDEGGVIEGDWTDLYSTAVAGMSGQGKTTSQRFFACQTALHGARFAVIDPHAGAGDDSLAATLAPLGSAFLCPIASDDKTMLDTVRHIADIGEKRIKGVDSDTTPVILWVDELTSLLSRSTIGDELAGLLEKIAQEYRKKKVYVSASGQIWTASRATSELRDSFASVLCHRMKRGQARLLLPTDEAQLVERLSPGRAVLWRTSGATTIVGIPNTTAADVLRVATMIGSQAAPQAAYTPATERLPMGFHPAYNGAAKTAPLMPNVSPSYASGGAAYSQAQSGQAVPAEALRAYALLMAGKDPAEIVLELRGIKTSQGTTYQRALKEIMELIRLAIRGGIQ